MANETSTLVLAVDSTGVRRANTDLDTFAAKGKTAAASATGMATAMRSLSALVSVGTVAALAKQAIQTADAYTNMTARLSLVTKSTRELTQVQAALFSVAQRTRIDLEQTSSLYTSLARSTEALGVTQTEVLGVTESINKALVISGTSAASAQAALVQLGQAFSSGVLRGEELNSVLEQAPRLSRAIADGLGVTTGQLRQMGADGEITAEKLFRAIQKAGEALGEEFQRLPATVGGAVTQVQTSITQLVGTLDKLTGTTPAVAGWVRSYSAMLDRIDARIKESGGVAAAYADNFRIDQAKNFSDELTRSVRAYEGLVKLEQSVGVSPAQKTRMIELREEIDDLQRSVGAYADSLKRAGLAPGQTVASLAGAGAGRGSINPETVGSITQKEQARLRAREAFYKEYATQEQKFTAEVAKQKELLGGVLSKSDVDLIRAKIFGAGKKAQPLDFLSGQTAAVRRELDATVGAYTDAERILDATRAMGLVREEDYYQQKRGFIEKNAAAQVAALEKENELIKNRVSKGQQRLDDDEKVADNLARIARLQAEAATGALVLGKEQETAANRTKIAFDSATLAAQKYLETVARQNGRELTALGLGAKAGQQARDRATIEDKYLGQVDEAMGERRRGEITEEALNERLRLIADTQAKEIAMWEKHSAEIDKVNGKWQTGTTRALQNYIDSANDVASQVSGALTNGFKNAEDAVVNFAMTGKGSFKDFANSVIADFLRIQTRAALSGVLSQVLGAMGGGGSVGNAGFGDYKGYYDGLAGARAIGGPVSAGSMYQVNERGPELLNVGNKQYLMTGSKGGSVTPNSGMGADNSTTINVAAGPTRNEVLTAIQLAVRASEAKQEQRLRKAGF